jgi:hypothetical protein
VNQREPEHRAQQQQADDNGGPPVTPGGGFVFVALGDACGDGHRRSIAAAAGAIDDAKIAACGNDRVAGRVLHLDAQLAAATVDIERAGLERRPPVGRVEIAERDEIVEQRAQIAVLADEAVDGVDRGDLGATARSCWMSDPSHARPSPASVRPSKCNGRAGQLSATQSFWSRSSRSRKSSALPERTRSNPPALANFHACLVLVLPIAERYGISGMSERPRRRKKQKTQPQFQHEMRPENGRISGPDLSGSGK